MGEMGAGWLLLGSYLRPWIRWGALLGVLCMNAADVLFAKVIIVSFLVGAIFGAYKNRNDEIFDGVEKYLYGAFCGAVGFPLVVVFGASAFIAIKWVIS